MNFLFILYESKIWHKAYKSSSEIIRETSFNIDKVLASRARGSRLRRHPAF